MFSGGIKRDQRRENGSISVFIGSFKHVFSCWEKYPAILSYAD